MRTLRLVAAGCLALTVLSGCSSGREDDVTATVEGLHAALRTGDGLAACDLLSDDAQEELAEARDTSCATEVVEVDLPDSGTVRDVEVYGTAAQVRFDDDIVFLAEMDDGWKVTAAGCTAEAGAPYDCTVQGG